MLNWIMPQYSIDLRGRNPALQPVHPKILSKPPLKGVKFKMVLGKWDGMDAPGLAGIRLHPLGGSTNYLDVIMLMLLVFSVTVDAAAIYYVMRRGAAADVVAAADRVAAADVVAAAGRLGKSA